MGRLIRKLEDHAPPRRGRLLYGFWMALALPLVVGGVGWACTLLPIWLAVPVAALLLWSALAMRTLAEAGLRMDRALRSPDPTAPGQALSWLCSRSPEGLSREELAAAAIESVAENASDSVVAPLFWFLVAGLPGALAYRAINTQDAMIGYRTERYEQLGKAAARLDDLVNLIPARLTAGLVLLASGGRGFAIWRRDANRTQSPNAGHPMAAMAGALGVRLEKRGHYALGDAERPVDEHALRRSVLLLGRISGLAGAGAALWLGGQALWALP